MFYLEMWGQNFPEIFRELIFEFLDSKSSEGHLTAFRRNLFTYS